MALMIGSVFHCWKEKDIVIVVKFLHKYACYKVQSLIDGEQYCVQLTDLEEL